jgi:hypothetical protein
MTERQQPPYPAGYRPVPDDDWREQTTPGLRAVPGPGAPPEYGSADYHRPDYEHPGYPPTDYPQPSYQEPSYQEPRYDRSGYGQPGYDQTGYEPPEYGQTRHDQPDYGQTGYGQTGYDRTGYDRTGHGQPGHGQPGSPTTTAPDYSSRPVAVRRPDVLAGLVLVLAGIAAGVSLLLKWLAGSEETGWTLLREGVRDLGGLFRTGLWQPLAIVVGGVLLFVVGLIVLVPARAHRTLGLVALLLTAAVAAGVLVPLKAAHWRLGVFDIGFFCAIGVAVLGLIGALKALLTGPRARP